MMSLGLDTGDGQLDPHKYSVLDFKTFQSTIQILQTVQQELSTILNSPQKDGALRVLLPIRRLNTALLDLLPPTLKTKARGFAELLILETNEVQQLEHVQKSLDLRQGNNQFALLAESKKLRLIAEETSDPLATWDLGDQVKVGGEKVGYNLVGSLRGEEGKVLVEYKSYEDPSIRQKLFGRMNEIVELCHSIKESESIKVLRCRGYFHSAAAAAFGLVYDFPSGFSSSMEAKETDKDVKTTTLYQILDVGRRWQQPLLTNRFKLAKMLAGSISELHKIGWVHKGISSSNVAFFYTSESNFLSALEKPYIVGFKHSRSYAAFTEGPVSDETEKEYEHPDYARLDKRYSPKYDYYSLGMVLLEIGLWKTLKKINAPGGLSPSGVREWLLTTMVPRLGQAMGSVYRDLVALCLGREFDRYDGIDDESERKVATQLRFEMDVLSKLAIVSQYEI